MIATIPLWRCRMSWMWKVSLYESCIWRLRRMSMDVWPKEGCQLGTSYGPEPQTPSQQLNIEVS